MSLNMPVQVSNAAVALLKNQKMLIGGRWVAGEGPVNLSIDPYHENVIAEVKSASPNQVAQAVGAARHSFDQGVWRNKSPEERAGILHRLGDLMVEHRDHLVEIFVAEGGCPISLARSLNVDMPIAHMRWLAEKAIKGPEAGWKQELKVDLWSKTAGYIIREPAGVVAALAPYNVPYIAYVWKAGTALAAGCSTVVMPSPRAQLSAAAFASLVQEAGVPDGVFNFIFGSPEAGKALTESPDVDVISFTGSNAVGAQVMAQASKTAKHTLLELGGKSPNIILPGTSVEDVVAPSLARLYRNAGQGCGVTSRSFVPRADYAQYVETARDVLTEMVVGDPWQEETWVGPLIRSEHRDRVEQNVERALRRGAKIEAGGGRPQHQNHGFFMNPVLVGNISNKDELSQEEQFGPVGVVVPYDDLEDMIFMANDTRYGLNANIWGEHDEAMKVAMQIRSGNVKINGGGQTRPDAPFSGRKQSGFGAEMGDEGFNEFLELKHISWVTG